MTGADVKIQWSDIEVVLGKYTSPSEEQSRYKSIPISLRDHPVVKTLEKKCGAKVRYRGPRPRMATGHRWLIHLGKSTCLKQDATHFSIYM